MEVVRFRRVGHESAGAARESLAAFSSRLLALLCLPVALVLLVRMLLGLSLLYPGLIGLAIVTLVTAFATYQYLRGTTVAVLIYGDAVALETALTLVRRPREKERHWFHVLDVKGSGERFTAVIGLDTLTFDRAAWHAFDSLRGTLENARAMNNRSDD